MGKRLTEDEKKARSEKRKTFNLRLKTVRQAIEDEGNSPENLSIKQQRSILYSRKRQLLSDERVVLVRLEKEYRAREAMVKHLYSQESREIEKALDALPSEYQIEEKAKQIVKGKFPDMFIGTRLIYAVENWHGKEETDNG